MQVHAAQCCLRGSSRPAPVLIIALVGPGALAAAAALQTVPPQAAAAAALAAAACCPIDAEGSALTLSGQLQQLRLQLEPAGVAIMLPSSDAKQAGDTCSAEESDTKAMALEGTPVGVTVLELPRNAYSGG